MEERSAGKRTLRRMWERFSGTTARWWALTAALLGMGMLPCPGCGTPVIFHLWPVAGLLLVVRALKRRYRDESLTEKSGEEGLDIAPVDHQR